MKFEQFFDLAKAHGIEQSQLYVSKSSSFRIKLFRHEVENYSTSENYSVTATGICNGKFVSSTTGRIDGTTFSYLIEQMKLSAEIIEKPAEVDLFPGSPSYKKGFVWNKELGNIPAEKKLESLKKLENAIYDADARVTEADSIVYAEGSYERILMNSYGLRLKDKGNSFTVVGGAVVREGDETKTYYDVFFDNDFSKFNPEAMAKEIVKGAISKFGGVSCEAGKYPTVLKREIISDLLDVFLGSCSADEVQRHSSFLEGKLGKKVASSKLTIEENPFARNLYYYYFDDEGVAASRKTIVKNGVLQTYFHNRETANKEGNGATSTGNGRFGGRKMNIGYSNIFVKPGKKSFVDMVGGIKDGVYITEIAGLGTGLNDNSGDFSCQAEGYRIRDGKLAEPLTLITLSGNVLTMLEDLVCFDNEVELLPGGTTISNALIKKMNIGGL